MRYLLLAALVGCSAPERSKETLQKHGFTAIETHGHAFFACSDSDTYATAFTATNAQGQRVSGTVCCGMLKNCTVRF